MTVKPSRKRMTKKQQRALLARLKADNGARTAYGTIAREMGFSEATTSHFARQHGFVRDHLRARKTSKKVESPRKGIPDAYCGAVVWSRALGRLKPFYRTSSSAVYIATDLNDRLQEVAEEAGVPMAAIVDEILREVMGVQKPQPLSKEALEALRYR